VPDPRRRQHQARPQGDHRDYHRGDRARRCNAAAAGLGIEPVKRGDHGTEEHHDEAQSSRASNPLRIGSFDGSSSPTHLRSLRVLISDSDPTVPVRGRPSARARRGAAGSHVRLIRSFTYRDHTLRPVTRYTSG